MTTTNTNAAVVFFPKNVAVADFSRITERRIAELAASNPDAVVVVHVWGGSESKYAPAKGYRVLAIAPDFAVAEEVAEEYRSEWHYNTRTMPAADAAVAS